MDAKWPAIPHLFLALALAASLGQCQMSGQDKIDALNFMNYLRKNVVPPAADMNGLLWDTNLEGLAQKTARSCVFAHNYHGPYASLGETLYLGSRKNFTEILQFMFLEREIFNYSTGGCTVGSGKYPFFSTCGHYLQLAAAGVNKVGCGIQYCSGKYLAVCEYDRIWYLPPYQVGQPGTKCGNGYASYFKDGLCYAILVGHPPPIPGPFKCGLICLNYGTLTTSPFCSCACPSGFHGIRCETKSPYFASRIPNDCGAQAVTCKHGGIPTMFGTVCKCACPANFGGDNCQINKVQEGFSLAICFGGAMRYKSYYPVSISTWKNTLMSQSTQTYLTDAINAYCAANFAACCPGSTVSALPSGMSYFVTREDFHVTDNYPIGVLDGSLKVAVHYTTKGGVLRVCNGNAQSYVNRNVLIAAWPAAAAKMDESLAVLGLKTIRAE